MKTEVIKSNFRFLIVVEVCTVLRICQVDFLCKMWYNIYVVLKNFSFGEVF